MALLPDPTTAASEPSSVKNRLTGSRRRGSGINRHRSRTVSRTSLRGRHRVQAHPGRCRARASWAEKRLKKHEKTRKTLRNGMASLLRSNIQDFVQEVPVGQMAQGTPFRCLPWPPAPPVKPPSVQHTNQGWRTSQVMHQCKHNAGRVLCKDLGMNLKGLYRGSFLPGPCRLAGRADSRRGAVSSRCMSRGRKPSCTTALTARAGGSSSSRAGPNPSRRSLR